MLKRLLTLTALLVVLPTASAPAAGSSASHLRYAIDSNPSFDALERTARRQGIVVLQAWRLDELRRLKAANPNVKVLVYKNLSFATQGAHPTGLSSSGVSSREADERPEWYLRNTSGERFTSRGYGYLWAMDVGSSSYQARWAENVVNEVNRNGWDGVFLDDTNATMKYHYDVSRVAKYPSDSAYTKATTSALAHIGPRIRNAGKLAVPNNATWVEHHEVGVNWLQYVDGMMDEMFLKWSQRNGEGYRDEYQWNLQLNEIKAAERQNKMFLGVTQSGNDDHRAAVYGYATTLLATQGRAHFAMHGDYSNENWFPEYDLDIGSPTASESRDGNGVHRRPFTRGMVLVNPTSGTQTASLPGEYSGPEVGRVTRVTLAPHRGVVLEKVGADPPPPAANPPAANPPAANPPAANPPAANPPAQAPRVARVTPAPVSTGVSRAANLRVKFSKQMDAKTLNATTVRLVRRGTTRAVKARIRYVVRERTVVLDPSAPLARGAVYTAEVTRGARDRVGNKLAAARWWQFRASR